MLYILDQRLKAQKVTLSKSQQGIEASSQIIKIYILFQSVIQDIVSQMFDSNCVKELFRPQRVLTMSSLRVVFNRLAHASIMKLNAAAMEKVNKIRLDA